MAKKLRFHTQQRSHVGGVTLIRNFQCQVTPAANRTATAAVMFQRCAKVHKSQRIYYTLGLLKDWSTKPLLVKVNTFADDVGVVT